MSHFVCICAILCIVCMADNYLNSDNVDRTVSFPFQKINTIICAFEMNTK